MDFAEERLPEDIANGAEGGPEFSTDIVVLSSGHEQRNSNWQYPRARYHISKPLQTQAQIERLQAFFRARKGRAAGFRFKDWSDYMLESEAIGTGTGLETSFQLVKSYTSGGVQSVRTITKPVMGSISIFVDGFLQSSGVSVDVTTGVVTFDTAPALGGVITASGEFDVPVRFDNDLLQAKLEEQGSYSMNNIELVEIRL